MKCTVVIAVGLSAVFVLLVNELTEARQNGFVAPKCVEDQCKLAPAHFTLYSLLKRAIDFGFDVSGKQAVEVMRAAEVLSRRFDTPASGDLAGKQLVLELLNDKILRKGLEVMNSDAGSELLDIYRMSTGGRKSYLACSQRRIEDIERAERKLQANATVKQVLSKVHHNFVRKSAKKCMKYMCTSIGNSMSSIDSFVKLAESSDETKENETEPSTQQEAEFTTQERALCLFFRNSSDTSSSCEAPADVLNEVRLVSSESEKSDKGITPVAQLLETYASVLATTSNSSLSIEAAEADVRKQCSSIKTLLDYNLAPIKWYRSKHLFARRKFESRVFWCPMLAYWLEIDRLCTELDKATLKKPEATEESTTIASGRAPVGGAETLAPTPDAHLHYEIDGESGEEIAKNDI